MRTSEISTMLRLPHRATIALLVALILLPVHAQSIELRSLKLPSLHLKRRNTCTTVAKLDWHTSYTAACREAKRERKMLVINFLPAGNSTAQREFEKYLTESPALRKKLGNVVLARIPVDAKLDVGDCDCRLVEDPAFQHLGRKPGLAILDFKHADAPYYGCVVTALPYNSGKYYSWQNSHLAVALDLPAGTITQRTMVWAVRTHPEAPQSTVGEQNSELAEAAARHSAHQARIGVQGHHNWDHRFHQVRSVTHSASASEVVAESWPNQDLIDSCIDCVKSWRHSSGHWSAVRKSHRLFGYDIRKGRNGIWYGTGIFAN
jgi:hypothetical protein